jgi:hypothetical protein
MSLRREFLKTLLFRTGIRGKGATGQGRVNLVYGDLEDLLLDAKQAYRDSNGHWPYTGSDYLFIFRKLNLLRPDTEAALTDINQQAECICAEAGGGTRRPGLLACLLMFVLLISSAMASPALRIPHQFFWYPHDANDVAIYLRLDTTREFAPNKYEFSGASKILDHMAMFRFMLKSYLDKDGFSTNYADFNMWLRSASGKKSIKYAPKVEKVDPNDVTYEGIQAVVAALSRGEDLSGTVYVTPTEYHPAACGHTRAMDLQSAMLSGRKPCEKFGAKK